MTCKTGSCFAGLSSGRAPYSLHTGSEKTSVCCAVVTDAFCSENAVMGTSSLRSAAKILSVSPLFYYILYSNDLHL